MQEEIYHLDKQMFALKTMQKKMNQVLHHSSDRVKPVRWSLPISQILSFGFSRRVFF